LTARVAGHDADLQLDPTQDARRSSRRPRAVLQVDAPAAYGDEASGARIMWRAYVTVHVTVGRSEEGDPQKR